MPDGAFVRSGTTCVDPVIRAPHVASGPPEGPRQRRRDNHEPRCGSAAAVTPEEVMNRLTEYFGSPGTPPPPETFWLVSTEDAAIYVSPETAEALGREIARGYL